MRSVVTGYRQGVALILDTYVLSIASFPGLFLSGLRYLKSSQMDELRVTMLVLIFVQVRACSSGGPAPWSSRVELCKDEEEG